jgi:cytochrome c
VRAYFRYFWLTLLAVTLLGAVPLRVVADGEGPQSEKARQISSVVDRAAALIEQKGKDAAFAEFRKKGSVWFSEDTYVFVDDMAGNVLLNPPFPQYEGKNVIDQKDANGKLLQRAMVELLKKQEAGWVDYMWPKPGQTQPSLKWSYVRRVNLNGVPGLVGAGFYPE